MTESSSQFEQRKKDHIRIALDPRVQATGGTGLDQIELLHEALPEINFSDISLKTQFLKYQLNAPIFISSMTAGHVDSVDLNLRLARAAQARGWAMGVGSQRKELTDPAAMLEWKKLRQECPRAVLIGNIGITQLIQTPISDIQKLVDNLQASALFVHTNPLQECLQPEGTPQFKGGLVALKHLCEKLNVPVILKEVGCGFNPRTIERLKDTGIYALDVSGFGGTHWGRLEGFRSSQNDKLSQAAQTFENWGISTLESLLFAVEAKPHYEIWASGGVRSGLMIAKLRALGARMVGVAQPVLAAALQGEKELDHLMEQLEFELKVAMFCTGSETLQSLESQTENQKVWQWKKT